jgi:hypothetical protein
MDKFADAGKGIDHASATDVVTAHGYSLTK